MENATKALLIAAAVLVAVLIITLGVTIFTNSSEQVDGAGDLSEYQIQQFNDKFRRYEGTNESGSDVNALLKTVFSHNQSQENSSTMVKVTVDGKEKISSDKFDGTSSPEQQPTGARYTIKCTYDAQSKLITSIAVTTNKTTTTPPAE